SRTDLTRYTFFSDYPNSPSYLDVDANYLYWAEGQTGRLVRRPIEADPDAGSGSIEVIADSLPTARGIAVDGAVIYVSLMGVRSIDGGPVFGVIYRVDNRPGAVPVELAR